jgi:hypothetical protein
MLRQLVEDMTNVFTGSDSRPNRTLTAALLRYGFKGEGIIDESVIAVKSHYPERLGFARFETKRIILLVRNPFDALDSYFHMCLTNTHDRSLHPIALQSPELQQLWREFIPNEAHTWESFHEFWARKAAMPESRLQMIVVRFEDLTSTDAAQRTATRADIFDFLKVFFFASQLLLCLRVVLMTQITHPFPFWLLHCRPYRGASPRQHGKRYNSNSNRYLIRTLATVQRRALPVVVLISME